MLCCVCNGSCMHTGPHSYCYMHGGQYYTLPHIQWVGTYANALCDHCLCQKPTAREMKSRNEVPHKRCCHCQKLYAIEEDND